MNHLTITPRDPLVARDGRPFGPGAGNRMRSTGWLMPSVAAGSFRTALAKAAGVGFERKTQDELLRIEFAGVLPLAGTELLLPAPYDCVIEKKKDGSLVARAARPRKMLTGEGCDWPEGELWPVTLGNDVRDFKPDTGPAFWPMSRYVNWLLDEGVTFGKDFATEAKADLRDHVEIDPLTGSAMDARLFTTGGIAARALPRFQCEKVTKFEERMIETTLSARVGQLPSWSEGLEMWHPLGGERRLAHWKLDETDADAWKYPKEIRDKLATTTHVTMTLVTPAIFEGGWRPPRKLGEVELKLVGVCIPRWRAVSGWSYIERGPKAIRRMVPAGGTYFFTVGKQGDAAPLEKMWLESVSDDEQDRRDGFGLAVWGTWEGNH